MNTYKYDLSIIDELVDSEQQYSGTIESTIEAETFTAAAEAIVRLHTDFYDSPVVADDDPAPVIVTTEVDAMHARAVCTIPGIDSSELRAEIEIKKVEL